MKICKRVVLHWRDFEGMFELSFLSIRIVLCVLLCDMVVHVCVCVHCYTELIFMTLSMNYIIIYHIATVFLYAIILHDLG